MEEDIKMDDDTPEESSWTYYIEGFMCDMNNDDDDGVNSSDESPSLVSDAASSAAKKLISMNPSIRSISKQNSSPRKQKSKNVMSADYHELEDTASSPVNSPRVSYINHFMNPKEKSKNKMIVSEVKRNIFARDGEDDDAARDAFFADLKKKNGG